MIFRFRADEITDRTSFHAAIAAGLNFPDYYGHNLDALEECLGDFVARLSEGETLTIDLGDVSAMARLPWETGGLVDVLARINRGLIDEGHEPRIFLAYRGRLAQPTVDPPRDIPRR